nr:MAG TPA: DsbDgamma gamma family gamma [Caudoviricetes sp.]
MPSLSSAGGKLQPRPRNVRFSFIFRFFLLLLLIVFYQSTCKPSTMSVKFA